MAAGANVVFRVKATGDDLHFQWEKDGDGLCATCTEMLCITEVKKGHRGHYTCLVKNYAGKQFSAKALLTVSK